MPPYGTCILFSEGVSYFITYWCHVCRVDFIMHMHVFYSGLLYFIKNGARASSRLLIQPKSPQGLYRIVHLPVSTMWIFTLVGCQNTDVSRAMSVQKLVRKGASLPFMGPEPACGIRKSTAYNTITKRFRAEHCCWWQNYSGQTLAKRLARAQ